ncbi:hypothetical protein LZ30DRAFT_693325 [Colletotrichum cereale]|nr:hypothetical protein LZ30DRAFT_693325 [Colletotrichum cereale]
MTIPPRPDHYLPLKHLTSLERKSKRKEICVISLARASVTSSVIYYSMANIAALFSLITKRLKGLPDNQAAKDAIAAVNKADPNFAFVNYLTGGPKADQEGKQGDKDEEREETQEGGKALAKRENAKATAAPRANDKGLHNRNPHVEHPAVQVDVKELGRRVAADLSVGGQEDAVLEADKA